MTDQQFSDLMKVLRSIDGNLTEINKQMPQPIGSSFISIQNKLEEIKSSVDDVELAITQKK